MHDSAIEKPTDSDAYTDVLRKLLEDATDAIKEYDDYAYAIRNERNIIPPEKIIELRKRIIEIKRQALKIILMSENDGRRCDQPEELSALMKELADIKETFHGPIDQLRADEGTCRETQF